MSSDAREALTFLAEPKHIVALSGGKDSTAMAIWLTENEPRDYTFVCTPTGDEPDAMFAHWRKLAGLLGKPILPITYRTGLVGLIREQHALPNWRQRWCTRILKIEPYAAFLMQCARQRFPTSVCAPMKRPARVAIIATCRG